MTPDTDTKPTQTALNTNPLVVFVHVPKTAGSTVNRVLKDHFSRGYPHCEAIVNNPRELARHAGRADWISGHVDYGDLRRAMQTATTRKLRLFSVMRDPIKQVASHYNWMIEIFHKGPHFYNQHPPIIREISAKLRASDNSDIDTVIRNLSEHPGLFLNQQARTLMGHRFNWNSGRIIEHLSQYEFVATEDTLTTLLSNMIGKTVELAPHENASSYHVDRAVFGSSRMKNFLMRANYLDWLLYQTLRVQRTRSAISPAYRLGAKPKRLH